LQVTIDQIQELLSERETAAHTAFLHCAKALLEYTAGLREKGETVELCTRHSKGPQSKAQFERLVWNEIQQIFGDKVPKLCSELNELGQEQRRDARMYGRSNHSVELTQDLREGFLFNTLAGFLGAASCFQDPQGAIDRLYQSRSMRRYRVPRDPADLLVGCTDDLALCLSQHGRLLNDLSDTGMVIDNPDYVPNERRGSTDAGGGTRNIRKADGL
jgi:hypothetical protein